jgi:hypothetical protein
MTFWWEPELNKQCQKVNFFYMSLVPHDTIGNRFINAFGAFIVNGYAFGAFIVSQILFLSS